MKKFIVASMLVSSISAWGAPNVTSCAACHGAKGVSANPVWPNLAGQGKDYLAKQLRAFKSGERKDPLMSSIANTINDADVESIAEYYSKLSR